MYRISIEENIKRIFITNKFTKTLRPYFGLDRHIDKSMQLQNLSYLKEDIITQLRDYEPRINLEKINFELSTNGLELDLVYTKKGSNLLNNLRVKV